jgi:hypothetical protein
MILFQEKIIMSQSRNVGPKGISNNSLLVEALAAASVSRILAIATQK